MDGVEYNCVDEDRAVHASVSAQRLTTYRCAALFSLWQASPTAKCSPLTVSKTLSSATMAATGGATIPAVCSSRQTTGRSSTHR